MLSAMLSFMRKTSRMRRNPESEGIYLSDLNADELDPEVAALYFPSSHRGQTAIKGKQLISINVNFVHISFYAKCIKYAIIRYIHRWKRSRRRRYRVGEWAKFAAKS